MSQLGIYILLIASLLGTYISYQSWQRHPSSSALLVLAMGSAAATLAALSRLLLNSDSQDVATLERILSNLAIYAGSPMMATALLANALQREISRPAWGRWLLALIALFELCRRMGYGTEYTQLMIAVGILTVLVAVIRCQAALQRAALALIAVGAATALWGYSAQLSLPVMLGAALALLASAAIARLESRTQRQN